ncbi:hypothetical protein NL676_039387 [Syzygium grande]|nr:hypothetical protein NL676_039387 [Syzygium grande]
MLILDLIVAMVDAGSVQWLLLIPFQPLCRKCEMLIGSVIVAVEVVAALLMVIRVSEAAAIIVDHRCVAGLAGLWSINYELIPLNVDK